MDRRIFLKGLLAVPIIATGCKAMTMPSVMPKEAKVEGVNQSIMTRVSNDNGSTYDVDAMMTVDEITKDALKIVHENELFLI